MRPAGLSLQRLRAWLCLGFVLEAFKSRSHSRREYRNFEVYLVSLESLRLDWRDCRILGLKIDWVLGSWFRFSIR